MTTLMSAIAARSSSPELVGVASTWMQMKARLDQARQREEGMTTETVIITAGLSALAVAVVAIIVARVNSRARTIQ